MQRTLDVAIPAYNEAEVILSTLRLIADELARIPDCSWRIIVAENGSTDDTARIVEDAEMPNVLVFSAKGKGKGGALREAAERSHADYFAFIDADASAHPKTLADMLDRVENEKAALLVGSRFHPESMSDRALLRTLSSRIFNMLARTIVGVSIDDTQCPLKIMNRDGKNILLATTDTGFFFDLEMVARAERSGGAIATHPVEWMEFRYPGRRSKIDLASDGLRAIRAMFELRKMLDDNNI